MPKQVWQAEDGTQFDNEKNCLIYEKFHKELQQIQIPDEMRSFINHWDSDPIHFLAKNFYEISAANRKCVDFLDSLESAVFGPNLKNVLIQKKKEEEEKKYQTQ